MAAAIAIATPTGIFGSLIGGVLFDHFPRQTDIILCCSLTLGAVAFACFPWAGSPVIFAVVHTVGDFTTWMGELGI